MIFERVLRVSRSQASLREDEVVTTELNAPLPATKVVRVGTAGQPWIEGFRCAPRSARPDGGTGGAIFRQPSNVSPAGPAQTAPSRWSNQEDT